MQSQSLRRGDRPSLRIAASRLLVRMEDEKAHVHVKSAIDSATKLLRGILTGQSKQGEIPEKQQQFAQKVARAALTRLKNAGLVDESVAKGACYMPLTGTELTTPLSSPREEPPGESSEDIAEDWLLKTASDTEVARLLGRVAHARPGILDRVVALEKNIVATQQARPTVTSTVESTRGTAILGSGGPVPLAEKPQKGAQ
eukprot:s652_g2.t1